jgi:hypothetical protein
MTTYALSAKLTDGATDADSDPITVRSIDGSVVTSWPKTVTLTTNQCLVYEDGTVVYDDTGDTSGHPADTATATAGTFTFTLWDGLDESATYTATIKLTGAASSDTTAPTLSNGTSAKVADTGFTASFDTDENNGDVSLVLTTRNTAPMASEVESGQDDLGNPAAWNKTQPVTVSGATQSFGQTGVLTASTAYYPYGVHRDTAGNISTVLSLPTFTTDATPVTTSDPPATVTVANGTAATTKLDEWLADWNGTAATLGIGSTESRYIEVSDSTNGRIDYNGKQAPYPVYIRAATKINGAVFGDTTYGAHIKNCKNLYFKYLKFTDRVTFDVSSNNCGIQWCEVVGDTSGTRAAHNGVEIVGTNGRPSYILVQGCYIHGFAKNGIYATRTDHVDIWENFMDELQKDDINFGDSTFPRIRRNWSQVKSYAGLSAHLDFIQFQTNTATGLSVTDAEVSGNCCAYWQKTNTTSGPWPQGIFLSSSGGAHDRAKVFDNVVLAATLNNISVIGATTQIYNNTTIHMTDQVNPNNKTGSSKIVDSNATTFNDNVSQDNGTPSGTNATNLYGADLTQYFGGSGYNGQLLASNGSVSHFYPVLGSNMHWSDTGATGAYNRLKEIFVDGLHPGNAPGAIAAAWNAKHNADGRITS